MGPLQRTPGTAPTPFTQDRPWLRRREQISLVKNRMREICTSGSVRDGDGNAPIYSALHLPQLGQAAGESRPIGKWGECTEECQLAGREGGPQLLQEQPPEQP